MTFDNGARTGQIRQHLDSQVQFQSCNRQVIDQNSPAILIRRDILFTLDCLVSLITTASFILCSRSLWSGHCLCKEILSYYSKHRAEESPLTWSELQVFYSFWYILMVITDLMVITGTIIKMGILFKVR